MDVTSASGDLNSSPMMKTNPANIISSSTSSPLLDPSSRPTANVNTGNKKNRNRKCHPYNARNSSSSLHNKSKGSNGKRGRNNNSNPLNLTEVTAKELLAAASVLLLNQKQSQSSSSPSSSSSSAGPLSHLLSTMNQNKTMKKNSSSPNLLVCSGSSRVHPSHSLTVNGGDGCHHRCLTSNQGGIIHSVPVMHHPIQMKAADGESRNERKLFVGMLSKKLSENNVRQIFGPFGTIEECTILRDATGSSKGCAFITYDTKSSAVNAIKSMNHSQTMEGCSSPLVVKFADSQKEKEVKRHNREIISRIWSSPSVPAALSSKMSSSCSNSSLSTSQQQQQQVTISSNPYLTTLATIATAAAQQQQQHQFAAVAALALQQQLAAVAGDPMSFASPLLGTFCTSTGTNPMTPLYTSVNPPNGMARGTVSPPNGMARGTVRAPTLLPQQLTSTGRYFAPPTQSLIPTLAVPQPPLVPATPTIPKQPEGPDGANLFIYHLPVEYGDADLAQIFSPFGNVISSRVFVDKNTHLSKCFGFVSFDCASSAAAAIQSMNGFQIGNKRLKVQLKRTKDKPY